MITTQYLYSIRKATYNEARETLETARAWLRDNCESWDDQDQQHYNFLLSESQRLMERVNTLDKLIKESISNERLVEQWF